MLHVLKIIKIIINWSVKSLTGALMRSRLRWTRDVKRMPSERLAKIAETQHTTGKAAAGVGGLCQEGYEPIRENMRWREATMNIALCKEHILTE